MNIFIVPGYGIPKDIFLDISYGIYLRLVFNTIYEKNSGGDPLIICTGGPTDMEHPFLRTEAHEQRRFLHSLADRPFCADQTASWRFVEEDTSLSTLENIYNTAQYLEKENICEGIITIFCEYTRCAKMKAVCTMIFSSFDVQVIPIDFDTSAYRYLDHSYLLAKEEKELAHYRWATMSPKNMQAHHRAYEEKLAFLRSPEQRENPDAIKLWWKERMEQLEKEAL